MKTSIFKLIIFLSVIFFLESCTKNELEDLDAIKNTRQYDLVNTTPLIGTYKGGINAKEGNIITNQSSNYYLSVSSIEAGTIRVKGNGISYYDIMLIEENGVVKPHPSMTYVKDFTWDSKNKEIDFIISKPYVFIKCEVLFSY